MGLFNKKPKQQPEEPQQNINLGPFFIEVASAFYRGVGKDDGSSEVTATLEFDEQHRVTNVKNPTVDGAPAVPQPEMLEEINSMTTELNTLPSIHHIKALSFSIKDGAVQTDASYREN